MLEVLSRQEKDFFKNNGYLVLPPGRIYDSNEIQELKSECDIYFPEYSKGKIQSSELNKLKIGFSGSPKNYIYNSGDIAEFKKNPLFGMRTTIIAPKYSQGFVDALENKNLLTMMKELLYTDKLSIHNSAVACVYPGTNAEPGNFHADTSGFSDKPLRVIKDGKFMINAFTYLVDVDEVNAPIRLLPCSHIRYLELNTLVTKSFRSCENHNNIGQFNFYDEFIPENFEKPIRVTGKAGTTVVISGDLLHSATSNTSKEKVRYTLAVWYSARNNTCFYKDYSNYSPYCQDFINKFKDKTLPYNTYYKHSISRSLKFHKVFKKISGNLFSKIRNRIIKFFNRFNSVIPVFQSPWNTAPLEKKNSKKLIYMGHLKSNKEEAEKNISDFINKIPIGTTIYFVAPNADSFLKMYNRKDYVFFDKLPLKKYFYDESWSRYIIRYFSSIVSSYGSEDRCKDIILESNSKSFFNKLEDYELDLIKFVNVKEIEDDIPKSRWDKDSLSEVLFKNKLSPIEVVDKDREIVTQQIGGENGAWIMLECRIN